MASRCYKISIWWKSSRARTPATWIRPDSPLSCLPNSNSISRCMIPVNRPLLDGNEKKYLDECIESGWISAEGPFVKKLEAGFAQLMGCAYGVAVCNGSGAIEAALAALRIGARGERVLPTLTINFCASALVPAGARP